MSDALLETPVSGRERVTAVKIPVSRYTSPEFFAREMTDVWPKTWQLACTVDHVANPGDWHEYRVGHLSVLIVRGDDGVLRAFQNVCLHRGSELCSGSGTELAEIRCPFHRWTWGLDGRLREVPSRREFGVLNDDYPLIGVQVDTWGPMVFVNLDPEAEPLADFLDPVPAEAAWAHLEEFRGQALISVRADCNWKTLIEGFSETYHVQGIHREMLGMADDVNGPQVIWPRHGRLVQSYGLPSPRQGRPGRDEDVFASFVEVMGARIGVEDRAAHSGSATPVVGKELIYFQTGHGKPELWAVKPGGHGVLDDSLVVWKVKKNVPTRSSTVLVDDLLYMVDDGGIASCIDAKTGADVWRKRIGGNYSAAPLFADGRIYFFSEEGKATAIAPGRELKVVGEGTLEAGFMASPAVSDHALILRTKTHLYRVELPKGK